jgi:hypothetical protein
MMAMEPDGNYGDSENAADISVNQQRQPACGGRCAPGVCCGPGSSLAEQMTYMGAGRGDYIIETTYRWVGKGKGEFGPTPEELEEARSQQPTSWRQIGGFGSIVCLLGIIAWVLISGTAGPGASATTAAATPAPSIAKPGAAAAATTPPTNIAAHGKTPAASEGRMAAGAAGAAHVGAIAGAGQAPALRAGGLPAPSTEAPQQKSVVFDCLAGFEARRKEWSIEKQHWCCNEKKKGCPEPAEA